MYIFELLYKIIINLLRKNQNKNTDETIENKEQEEECDHVFLPIDSTKKILACSKCGMLIKAENLKLKPPANFFTGK